MVLKKTLTSLVNIVKANNEKSVKVSNDEAKSKGVSPVQTIPSTDPGTLAFEDSEQVRGNNWTKVGKSRSVQSGRRKVVPGRNEMALVVSRVKLGTLGLQIRQYFANKDVEIRDITLLTKREDASFLSFKVIIRNENVEKLHNASSLTDWVIREYVDKEKSTRNRKTQNRSGVTPAQVTQPLAQEAKQQNVSAAKINSSMELPGWYFYAPKVTPAVQSPPTPRQASTNPTTNGNFVTAHASNGSHPLFSQGNAGHLERAVGPSTRPIPPTFPATRGAPNGSWAVGNVNGQSPTVQIPWSQVVTQDSPNVYGVNQFIQQ